ncbi:MAG TPA: T9SS type A sorting domain-containing protein [Chitinophagaceae bacterium]|nr:T9SS type A sorting domain-containing protein [Chitinophagaceae bacterium]
MRNLSILLLLLFSFYAVKSQTLDWSSSFTPAWVDGGTSGTANNVGGSGVNVTVNITNSQAGTYQNVTGAIPAPSVNTDNGRAGFFIIAGSTDCLEIDVNWTSNTAFVDVVYNFSQPVYGITFRVGDIDKNSPTTNTYFDRVTISGLNNGATILPQSITELNPSGYLTIAGNVVYANTTSGAGGNAATNTTALSTQQASVEVSFGSRGLTQLTLRYDNQTGAQANPALQAIAIGNLTFSKIVLSGTVWNDVNNSANGTFTNIFTSGETGTNTGSPIYANLVDNAGNVVNTALVAADGTYSLTAPLNTTGLTLRLSTVQGVVGSPAPSNNITAGWTNTSPLQTAAFNTTTSDIAGNDFGIEALPETAINTQPTTPNPGGFTNVVIPSAAFQNSTGGNPNTGDLTPGSVSQMRITAFPSNANTITINGTTYINGGTCPPATTCITWPVAGITVAYNNGSGIAVPVSIDPQDGNVAVVLPIAAIDNAGKEDPSPGSITLNFTSTLPVKILDFSATKTGNDVKLSWVVENQENLREYRLEASNTGREPFNLIVTLSSNNQTSGAYTYTDFNVAVRGTTMYYRLKAIDNDNSYSYSKIILVNFVKGIALAIRPTIVHPGELLTVSIVGENAEYFTVNMLNMTGQLIQSSKLKGGAYTQLNTDKLLKGVYIIQVSGNEETISQKIILQ